MDSNNNNYCFKSEFVYFNIIFINFVLILMNNPLNLFIFTIILWHGGNDWRYVCTRKYYSHSKRDFVYRKCILHLAMGKVSSSKINSYFKHECKLFY